MAVVAKRLVGGLPTSAEPRFAHAINRAPRPGANLQIPSYRQWAIWLGVDIDGAIADSEWLRRRRFWFARGLKRNGIVAAIAIRLVLGSATTTHCCPHADTLIVQSQFAAKTKRAILAQLNEIHGGGRRFFFAARHSSRG
jgi:hypothetical protein